MKKIKLFRNTALSAVAVIALAACQQSDAPAEGEAEGGEKTAEATAWGYGEADGPAKWGDLSEEYATCKTGKEQSPVDLPAADAAKTIQVTGNYASGTSTIEDTGLGVKASFEEGMTLTSGENTYNLLQFHYHTPSENTIAGKSFPLTAHLVHADGDGNLAVLGVMFEEGAANPEVQKTIDNIGKQVDVDVKAMLPSDMTVYNFKGSLTTPPCSEGVNWHVLTTPVTASKEQIDALVKLQGNNARPVQPMNDRAI